MGEDEKVVHVKQLNSLFTLASGLADECNTGTKKTTPLILFKQTE